MNLHFAQTTDGMKPAGFGRDELHVLEEHRYDGHPRFLRDVINSRLAVRHVDAISAGSLRKNHQMEFAAGAGKNLQFADAIRIELSALEQEADAAAQKFLQPSRVPDALVAKHQDRITPGTPAQRSQHQRVQEADVIADE